MTSVESLVIDAATSARGTRAGQVMQEQSLQQAAERLESTVAAVGLLEPSAARALEVLRHSSDYPAVVAHPALRYLLAAIRRSAHRDVSQLLDFLTYGLSTFAWPRELRDGLGASNWPCRLDEDGGLRGGGCGVYFEFGREYADAEVVVAVAADRALATVLRDGLTVEILASDLGVPTGEDLPNLDSHGFRVAASDRTRDGIEVSARDPWLRPRLTGTNQRTDGIGFFGATWEPYRDVPHLLEIEAGLDVIREFWPDAAQETALFDRCIVPLAADWTAYSAFTVLSRQGAIYLGGAPPMPMAEMILHETAHVKLRQMQLLDPLLVDPLDESFRVKVPWRPDPRPLPGVLEGLFVFVHIAELQIRLRDQGADPLVPAAPERLANLVQALDILTRNANLTTCGRQFLHVMGDWIDDLRARL